MHAHTRVNTDTDTHTHTRIRTKNYHKMPTPGTMLAPPMCKESGDLSAGIFHFPKLLLVPRLWLGVSRMSESRIIAGPRDVGISLVYSSPLQPQSETVRMSVLLIA